MLVAQVLGQSTPPYILQTAPGTHKLEAKSFMKRKLVLFIALSLLLALFATGSVFAQSPGGLSYESSIQVVNLDAASANIGLTYYNQDGTVGATASDTVPGNGSVTYFPIHAPTGFNGSVVVSSDKPITAIANTHANSFAYSAATTSFDAGSTSVSLPLIMCNNSGFNTWFNVQNASTNTANITIDYVPGAAGSANSENDTLAPGAAHTYDQASGSSGIDCADLGNFFVGSATVTSDQPVVATAMQLNTSTLPILLGYNGFTGGSTTVQLPLVMAQNSGFYTSINVQNVGTSNTDVTVDYSPNAAANGFEPNNETCNLDAGEGCVFIQNGTNAFNTWNQLFVGGATISASEDLVVVVNQQKFSGGKIFGSAYEGFDPAGATGNVSTPLIMAQNGGYYTSINVVNIGGSTCSVSIDYSPNAAPNGFEPSTENFSLAAGESKSVIQNGNAGPGNNSINNWTQKYVGSAEVAGSGCSLIAIVNEQSPLASGDTLLTYIGTNH
jgi:hypothetical protein